MTSVWRFTFVLPISFCVLVLGGHANANEAIEEFVITETKGNKSLQDLAGNTASLDEDQIDALAFDHISEALNQLPGVNLHHNNGQEHLTAIRSPVLTGGAGAGSFLYLEDGIPLRSPGFANVNGLFEAHGELAGRIEVVRGPGSALYGSNAVHGLVNFLSRDLEIPTKVVDINIGPHEQMAGKLSITGDLDTDSSAGLFVTLKHDDGYRANSGYDQQKATLKYAWSHGDTEVTAVLSGHNLNQETAGFVQGFEAYKNEALSIANANPEAYRDAKALRGYLRWQRKLSDNLSLSLTPYFRHTEMEFFMHFLPGQSIEENGHDSIGLQASMYKDLDGDHLIVAGVDIEYTDGFLTEIQPGPTIFSFVTGTHYDYSVEATLLSPYLHTEWQLTDSTRLTAGIRLDHTIYDYDNHTATNTVGRFQRISDRTDRFTTVTPKLGLTHQIQDELTLFGLYARGQRAPQTTDLYRLQINQVPGEADPEIMDSIEFGLRDSIGDIRWEVSAYAMKKKNFFFRDSDGFNVSEGKTKHVGIEASLSAPIGEHFDIAGSVSYAKHTYDFDNLVAANSTEDIFKGNDIDTAPHWLGNLRLGWSPLEQARVELEWIHMDKYFTDGANTNSYDGHDLLNLRAHWQLTDELSIYGRIENLTDTAYAERADFAFGNHRYFPGETRSFFIGIRADY